MSGEATGADRKTLNHTRPQGNAGSLTADDLDICTIDDIPVRGSRIVRVPDGEIALFRTAEEEVYALANRCPHAGGPLSQGIVHGKAVTCPLHNWVVSLETGTALGADQGQVPVIPLRVEGRRISMRRADLPKGRLCGGSGGQSPCDGPKQFRQPDG